MWDFRYRISSTRIGLRARKNLAEAGATLTSRVEVPVMAFMFELYYKAPADKKREVRITDRVSRLGGRLDLREVPKEGDGAVCLTYEFDRREQAEAAAATLRSEGEH